MLTSNKLSNLQLELLKLFQFELPEKNLLEINDIIAQYLAKQAVESANEDWNEKGLSNDDMEKWENEHNRAKSK